MKIVPLTSAIYTDFNGGPPPYTVKGVAIVDGSKAYAVCGTFIAGGENFIFFGCKPGFSKRDIIKGWRVFKAMISNEKNYYVIIDRELETSKNMLEHFNFIHLEDDTYIYGGH